MKIKITTTHDGYDYDCGSGYSVVTIVAIHMLYVCVCVLVEQNCLTTINHVYSAICAVGDNVTYGCCCCCYSFCYFRF